VGGKVRARGGEGRNKRDFGGFFKGSERVHLLQGVLVCRRKELGSRESRKKRKKKKKLYEWGGGGRHPGRWNCSRTMGCLRKEVLKEIPGGGGVPSKEERGGRELRTTVHLNFTNGYYNGEEGSEEESGKGKFQGAH